MAKKDKTPKDFSNPHKMGFMRLLMIWSFLIVVLSVAVLALSAKDAVPLADPTYAWSFVVTIYNAVLLWLLVGRKAAARTVVWIASLVAIAVHWLFSLLGFESFSIGASITNSLMYLILPLYFTFSRRAKAVLTRPFGMETREADLARHDSFFQPKTWPFWRNLIMYFCVFSVVGHWMEAGYCLFIKWGIIPGIYDPNSQIWSDWLYPFCVYGVGAVCCVLLFYPVRMFLQKRIQVPVVPLLLSYAWNALVCTGIELAMGLMLNQPVNGVYPLWDYSNMFCNFMGQVCLQNALAFGFVATLMTWVIYPALEHMLAKLPRDMARGLFIVVVVLFCMLFALYCVNFVF